MAPSRAAERRANRVRRSPDGWTARRAWRRLVADAARGEPAALAEVVALAAEGAADPHVLWDTVLLDGPAWWRGRLAAALWERGPQVPQQVVDRAWAAWLDDGGHDDLWTLLASWDRPAVGFWHPHSLVALGRGPRERADAQVWAELLAAVPRADHPVGDPARTSILAARDDTALIDAVCAAALGEPALAVFCTEHRLAPADPADRALFLVATGQHDQYRALDPDGALLAVAYRSADEPGRRALRTAMGERGDYDVLRVAAGGRRGELGDAERRYLLERLTGRGEWERLWQLVRDLPLPDAVAQAHRFGGWRPADPAQRELLGLLAGAARDEDLVAATERWVRTVPARLAVLGGIGEGAVAPHGKGMAVVRPLRADGPSAPVDHRADGTAARTWRAPRGEVLRLLHLGEEIIAVERAPASGGVALARYVRDGRVRLWRGEWLSGPFAFADGYVVLAPGGWLLFGRPGGEFPDRRELLTDEPDEWLAEQVRPHLLASDPVTGRLVVRRANQINVVDGYEGQILARGPGARGIRWLAFTGEHDLVALERHGRKRSLRAWRFGPPDRDGTPGRVGLTGRLVPVPATARVEALEHFGRVAVRRGTEVDFRDPRTLERADPPVEFGFAPREVWQDAHGLWLAAADQPATRNDVRVEIHGPPWGAVLARPLAEGTLADLAAVNRALPKLTPGEPLRRLLELYRTCLEVRLDGEITLGRSRSFAAADDADDIAL